MPEPKVCELCEWTPGGYYEHAPDCEENSLCSGSGVGEFDCNGKWGPCPACSVLAVIL